MSYNALLSMLELFGKERRHDTGGGTGENRILTNQWVQTSEHLLLQLYILRNALLNTEIKHARCSFVVLH